MYVQIKHYHQTVASILSALCLSLFVGCGGPSGDSKSSGSSSDAKGKVGDIESTRSSDEAGAWDFEIETSEALEKTKNKDKSGDRSERDLTVAEDDPEPDPDPDPDPVERTCEEEAGIVFNERVQPGIDNTCANCHFDGNTTTNDFFLDSGAAAANREALIAYSNLDAGALFDKVANVTTHGGGDQSANLSQADVEAWTTAESACDE